MCTQPLSNNYQDMHSANPPETYLTEENALPLLKYMVKEKQIFQLPISKSLMKIICM